jgi:hypothetical protein
MTPKPEFLKGIELEEVEELVGEEAVPLLELSRLRGGNGSSLSLRRILRRFDEFPDRRWRRPIWTWLLMSDCSFAELRVKDSEVTILFTKR